MTREKIRRARFRDVRAFSIVRVRGCWGVVRLKPREVDFWDETNQPLPNEIIDVLEREETK